MNKKDEMALSNAGFGKRIGFGKKPALLVVDFCVGFTNSELSAAGGDYDAEMNGTNEIIEVMRRKNLPVIFMTIGYNLSMANDGIWRLKWGLAYDYINPENVKISPILDYRPEEDAFIVKQGASAFFGTNLSAVLASRHVDTCIIVGVTTSGCIRATAVDSMQYGFRPIVVKECVGDRAEGPHNAALFDIDSKYGDVISLEETLTEIEKY